MLKPPTEHQRKRLEKLLAHGEEVILVTSIGDRYYWFMLLMLLPFAILLIGLPKFSHLVRMKQSYTYALTNRRFIIIRGIFSRKIVTAPLSAITHITVEQSISQRYIFNTGHLVIITAGFDQREIVIEHISRPVEFKILIEELTRKLEDSEYGVSDEDQDDKKPKLRALSV